MKTTEIPAIIAEATKNGCRNENQMIGFLASEVSRLRSVDINKRFHLDSESGFVLDKETDEWLTTAEEVFEAISIYLSNVGDHLSQRDSGSGEIIIYRIIVMKNQNRTS